jgi:hypothetical protein
LLGKPLEETFKNISSDKEEKNQAEQETTMEEETKEKTIAYGETGSFEIDDDVQHFLNNLFDFLIFTKLIITFEMLIHNGTFQ